MSPCLNSHISVQSKGKEQRTWLRDIGRRMGGLKELRRSSSRLGFARGLKGKATFLRLLRCVYDISRKITCALFANQS
jgi:hypothetical protein